MTSAYCIRCQCLKEESQMQQVFVTGFICIHGTDYPMGVCTRHVEDATNPVKPTRKIAN